MNAAVPPEPALDEVAFDRLFAEVITPAMAAHEAERRRRVALFARICWVGGVILAAITLALMIHTGEGATFMVFVFGALAGGGLVYERLLLNFENSCKAEALADLARALGMDYRLDVSEPPAFDRLRELGLLPTCAENRFKDLFSGVHAGCAFQLYQAHLDDPDEKHASLRFQGQIIRVAFPKAFLGTTVVNRQAMRGWKHPGFQRVILESNEFERDFEVFGTDQVEARYLVHPVFMERLTALEAAGRGRNLRCAFDGGDLIVVIEGVELFDVIDVFKPLPDRDGVLKGWRQLQQLTALVDQILARPGAA